MVFRSSEPQHQQSSPRGTPPKFGWNRGMVALLSRKPAISLKWNKIGPRLLMMTNRKSHMHFWLVQKWMFLHFIGEESDGWMSPLWVATKVLLELSIWFKACTLYTLYNGKQDIKFTIAIYGYCWTTLLILAISTSRLFCHTSMMGPVELVEVGILSCTLTT